MGVGESEEVVQDPTRPFRCGSAAEGLLVMREADEIVEGGVEQLEPSKAVA